MNKKGHRVSREISVEIQELVRAILMVRSLWCEKSRSCSTTTWAKKTRTKDRKGLEIHGGSLACPEFARDARRF